MSGRPFVGPGLRGALDCIEWPAYYLDFETFKPALPLYPNTAPHQQIPTQYSIHVCAAIGQVIDHREYLSDPQRDCRCELAAQLVGDLGNKGSILTYTDFESRVITSLADACPGLQAPLNRLLSRCVDLEAILGQHFCHPDFHGRTSIKVVLPALVPGQSYHGLAISDGDSASAIYANMVRGKYTAAQMEAHKKALLTYCQQDTLSMVHLHAKLMEHV